MKNKILYLLISGSAFLILLSATIRHANGSISGYTGSPIDGGVDCSNCHSGGSAPAVVSITALPAFGPGNTYTPNTTYTVSESVSGYSHFGVDLEMVSSQSSSSTTDAGTFVGVVSNCKITPPFAPYPTNITQTAPIPAGQSAVFTWKSPASGTVYLYTCGLGANFDQLQTGDKPVLSTLVLTPSPQGIQSNEAARINLNVFPNPASTDIHLRYSLENKNDVTIGIYDLRGKLVTELFHETLEQGEQQFDSAIPASLSKGIYTVNVVVGGIPAIRKLVIR
jgi:hypothetical protein